MKYRMALSLAVICEWIDERVLGHAERWFPLWVPVRYPFCEWSYRLHEWAAEISFADFLEKDELDSECEEARQHLLEDGYTADNLERYAPWICRACHNAPAEVWTLAGDTHRMEFSLCAPCAATG